MCMEKVNEPMKEPEGKSVCASNCECVDMITQGKEEYRCVHVGLVKRMGYSGEVSGGGHTCGWGSLQLLGK